MPPKEWKGTCSLPSLKVAWLHRTAHGVARAATYSNVAIHPYGCAHKHVQYPFMHSPSTSGAKPPLGRRVLRLYTHQRDETTLDTTCHVMPWVDIKEFTTFIPLSRHLQHNRTLATIHRDQHLSSPLLQPISTRVTFNLFFHSSCPQSGSEEVRQSGSKHPR